MSIVQCPMSLLYFIWWFLEVSSVFTQLLSTAVSTHLRTYTTATFHLGKFGDDRLSSFVVEKKYSAEVRPNFSTRSACTPEYSASAEHYKGHVRCISNTNWLANIMWWWLVNYKKNWKHTQFRQNSQNIHLEFIFKSRKYIQAQMSTINELLLTCKQIQLSYKWPIQPSELCIQTLYSTVVHVTTYRTCLHLSFISK